MGFGLPPISRLLSLVKGPVLFPRLFFTTCETQRAVRNCCSINIFRWYRSVHINGIDPSPITFLIHSGQGKNNLSSLSASQQPFLSALALYCWQFHQFHIFLSIEPHCTMLLLSTKSCLKSSKVRPILNGQFFSCDFQKYWS